MSSASIKIKANSGKKQNLLKLIPAAQKRVAIYCRVSTKGQKEEGTSLEKQLRGCLEKAHSDYGLETPSEKVIQSYIKRLEHGDTICENGIYMEDHSGAELTLRPILSHLRTDIRRSLYDVVMCFEVDRLSRKMSHRYILKEEFIENNVELVYVKQAFENNAQGEFMEAAHSFVAEVEREKIRDRSIDGKITRLKGGKIHRWGMSCLDISATSRRASVYQTPNK
jgi:site-specific DNA recombinase